MTKNAPTVCRAATHDADNSIKNTTFSMSGFRPMDRAWFSSKKVTIRSFHFANNIASVTNPIIASCSVSDGVMARMLPIVIV